MKGTVATAKKDEAAVRNAQRDLSFSQPAEHRMRGPQRITERETQYDMDDRIALLTAEMDII